MRHTPRNVVITVAAIAFAACGGGGGSSGQEQVSAESACNQLTAARDARFDQCLGMTRDGVSLSGSTLCARFGAEEALGRVHADAGDLATCLSDLAAYSCSTLQDYYGAPASCFAVFHGTVALGQPCRLMGGVGECASGRCEAVQGCGQEGVCTAWQQAGQSCAGDFERCAPNLVCGNDDRCAAVVVASAHEACGGNVTCAPDAYCDPYLDECLPRGAIDAACDYHGDNRREYNRCVPGAACNARDTCVRSRHLDEPCTPGDVECDYGTWCKGATPTATTGTCTAWPTVGGECGVLENDEVRECVGSWCENDRTSVGTCRTYLALNATCDPSSTTDDDRMCGPDAQCVEGTCQHAYCNY